MIINGSDVFSAMFRTAEASPKLLVHANAMLIRSFALQASEWWSGGYSAYLSNMNPLSKRNQDSSYCNQRTAKHLQQRQVLAQKQPRKDNH